MTNLFGKSVRDIAVETPASTRVFEEFKIDYCCHGEIDFAEACERAGIAPDIVKQKIEDIVCASTNDDSSQTAEMTLTELVNYILDKHHSYTYREMAQLTPLMEKVVARHGDHHAFLLDLKDSFAAVCSDLEQHMRKEEMVLFPYIADIDYRHSMNLSVSLPPFGTIRHPIAMMQREHEETGELLAKMREITDDYKLPEGACPSFMALYDRLQAFERDLHQHIHLENNVLFPRADELETKVSG